MALIFYKELLILIFVLFQNHHRIFSANPQCYSFFVVNVAVSVFKNRETSENPQFVKHIFPFPDVKDEAALRVDGGLRAAQEDPRRREGLCPEGGRGQGECKCYINQELNH